MSRLFCFFCTVSLVAPVQFSRLVKHTCPCNILLCGLCESYIWKIRPTLHWSFSGPSRHGIGNVGVTHPLFDRFPSSNLSRRQQIQESLCLQAGIAWGGQTDLTKVLLLLFMGPEPDHWQPLLVTNSLTNSEAFSRLDWCDPVVWRFAHSKLVEVVTFVDDSDKDRVGNSLLQISKLRFGHKAKLLFRLWAQGMVIILKLKLRRDFEAEVWSVFCCWCLFS